MSLFFVKSTLSLLLAILDIILIITMFEAIGRTEKRIDAEKMTRIHKSTGIVYVTIFALVTYFCLHFINSVKAELSPRASIHSLIAVTVLVLFLIKLSFIRRYRQFYSYVKHIGLLIAIFTFGLVSTSGGYYLIVTDFGINRSYDDFHQLRQEDFRAPANMTFSNIDKDAMEKGAKLFNAKCLFCHDAFSTEMKVGPGLKGILKRSKLPVSNRQATSENIIKQLKEPIDRMPSFEYLTEKEIHNLLVFLNSL